MNRGREELKKADTVVMVVSLAGGWTGQQFSNILVLGPFLFLRCIQNPCISIVTVL